MAQQEERLAELLCSRLCHDLAGAVGAVSAGAELLAEEGPASPMAAEAVSLLADSAASMTARLKFLRLALGSSSSSAPAEARPLAHAYLEKGYPQGEWKLDWPADLGVAESPDHAKLLLNMLCLAQDCLPRGGTIHVRPQEASVTARGDTVTVAESVQGLTAGELAGLGPRAGQGAYAAFLAARLGGTVAWTQGAGEIAFSVRRQGA
jgi:histidine phosphotransferase ChpT